MPKRKRAATKSKSRQPANKAKPRKGVVAKQKSNKPAAKKAKPVKRTAKPAARKPAKKATPRKAAKKLQSVTASENSPKAMRLTFSYQGDQVKLVSQQPVEMTVPPSDPLKGYEEHKGFWAEVKNAQDKTLFRRVLHNPTRNDAEVFSDDPEQSISRAPAPKRKGVFVVVVPHTEKGHEVTLSRSTGQPDIEAGGAPKGMAAMRSLATGPATEIARFKLKK
ncbi:MAG TPA: hypothetical protein VF961_02595 [Pyrinomonadaceae bacterium]